MMVKRKKGEISTDHTIVTAIDAVEETAQKRAYILFLTGPLVGKLHMLVQGESTMGRTPDCTIMVNDNRVSRQHVVIRLEGERAWLHDVGSTNGTFVNGERQRTCELQDGDKIQISSSTIFKFALQDRTENVFHKELYRMAVVDAVTNVYNKRYFMERLREEFSHATRTKKPLSVVMIDLDHFKQINDRYGHLAGDVVLHHVAQKLQGIIRTEDLLARYGGEEFVILLRGAEAAGALFLAERMRSQMAAYPIRYETHDIVVTMSLGIATHSVDQLFPDLSALVAAADQALYLSKRDGRNRVSTYPPPESVEEKLDGRP
ncbi:MAG: GGDEF domain-containing protein [Deltaproteobacteria bacterium]|nr:GGDEF domain-containing protein [Deltaproteobacteria bacterium]